MEEPLLKAKLFIPLDRPDHTARASLVPRPRLIEQLFEGLPGKLTLVCAPAGFGKTTLVSSWLAHTGLPAAWLSLDEDDVVAISTLKKHIGHIFSKLEVGNRTQTVARARELGLL
jgi:ATP/maltotriose-dependent transcriptional regulator MalT